MREINGQILKNMLISGSNNLYNHYPEVDALNVFPVPDGDTGMNMNLTMTSGAKEIQNRVATNAYEIAKAFSRGLLMGARGNSGVITSQIFRGFAQGLDGHETIDVKIFSDALQQGVEVAYKAVMRPVEGTILTVIRESSEALHQNIRNVKTIENAMDLLIEEANLSLKRTPDLLPILKEVGVVDSGGSGLIRIFEGMALALNDEFVERNQATATEVATPVAGAAASIEDEEFGYCTEFIMELGPDSVKKPFDETQFTKYNITIRLMDRPDYTVVPPNQIAFIQEDVSTGTTMEFVELEQTDDYKTKYVLELSSKTLDILIDLKILNPDHSFNEQLNYDFLKNDLRLCDHKN